MHKSLTVPWDLFAIAFSVCMALALMASPARAAALAPSAEASVSSGLPIATERDSDGNLCVSSEVIVFFEQGTTAEQAAAVLADVPGLSTDDIVGSDLDGALPFVEAKVGSGATIDAAIVALRGEPRVRLVQPNYIYGCEPVGSIGTQSVQPGADGSTSLAIQSESINDPLASQQWQLADTNCYDAWTFAKCDNNVGVAVLDSGCEVSHPDLAPNVVATYDAVDGATDATAVDDGTGHGTHVAGIISARANNGVGVAGVSYNANLVIIKVTQNGLVLTSSLTRAYNYLLGTMEADGGQVSGGRTVAQEHNVRVINLSIGHPGTTSDSGALETLIDMASQAGILTVCAAGNYNDPMPYAEWPGDYSSCLSVMALGNTSGANAGMNDTRWEESNYNLPGAVEGNEGKNLCAPGFHVLSTFPTSDMSYYWLDGTSMSAPVVSGIAALLFSEKPDLTPSQAMGVLCDTAVDLGPSGWDQGYGYGKVDALAAVLSISSDAVPVRLETTCGEDSHVSMSYAVRGEGLSRTIAADEGYSLPDIVSVTLGSSSYVIVSGEPNQGIVYDSATGILTIPGELMNAEVVISATCIVKPILPVIPDSPTTPDVSPETASVSDAQSDGSPIPRTWDTTLSRPLMVPLAACCLLAGILLRRELSD